MQGLIDNQNTEIERRQRFLQGKEQEIKTKFAGLERTLSKLRGQGAFLQARLGTGATTNKG